MRKRLLTILLSIFMATTIFTANVFADGFSTVGEIMETVGKFPKEGIFSWKNENDTKMYLNSSETFLKFDCYSKSLDGSVDFSDSKYTTTIISTSTLTLTFNIESNVLVSIDVRGAGAPVDGTYSAPSVTIADVLATASEGFPSWTDSEPANAWINENGKKLYTYNDDLRSAFDIVNISTKTVEKDDDSDNCMYNNNGQTYEFVMANNVLSRIIVSGYTSVGFDYTSYNGTYEAPVTIKDVLKTISGGFPETSSSGWVAQDGSRIYVNGDNLISSVDMPLNSVLTPSGDNYTIVPSFGYTFTFIMQSGVLSRIDKQPLGLFVSYYPYAYTNPSISKPVGYTGDIEFVTNGKYEGQSITPVTVKIDGGDPLTYGTQFEVSAGSTHVKLKGSYVSTLAIGTHTIEIGMTSDDPIKRYDPITSEFTITDAPSPAPTPDPTPKYEIPNTGVEETYSNNHSLLKLSSLSLLAIGTYLVIKKKKDND